MADTKTSGLSPATIVNPTDKLYLSQGGVDKNVSFDLLRANVLAIGLFTSASARTIPSGTDIVLTSGYSAAGRGHAFYIEDTTLDDAAVAAHPRARFKSANNRYFKLSDQQPINVLQFGAVADGATDDSVPFTSAIAYLKATAKNDNGTYKGSSALYVPPGHYYLGTTTLDITHTLTIEGDVAGMAGGFSAKLRWAANATGIRIQRYNTSGATTTDGVTHYGGDGTTIRNLMLSGGYNGGAPNEGEYHAIHAKARVTIEHVTIDNWQGDGVYSDANDPGTPTGNSNNSLLYLARITYCRNGVRFENANTNVWTVIAVDCSSNRQWAFLDSAFLGNAFIGCHADFSGMTDGTTPCQVTMGGSRYVVVMGQESGASTNSPKAATATITIASPAVVTWNSHGLPNGTPVTFSTTGALPTGLSANTTYYVVNQSTNTFNVAATVGGAAINTSGSQSGTHTAGAAVDNTWWYYLQAGGAVTSFNIRTWVSGTTYRAGGAYAHDDPSSASTYTGCYSESGQPVSQIAAPGAIFGGQHAANNKGSGFWQSNNFRGTLAVSGNFNCLGGVYQIGPGSDGIVNPPTDTIQFCDTTNSSFTFWGRVWPGGTTIGQIAFINGNGNFHDVGNAGWAHVFKINGSRQFKIDQHGFGYDNSGVGVGGAVTQATSRSTGVTLNKCTGEITLFSAAGSTSWTTFRVTNSHVAANDTIKVVQQTGTDKYMIHVTNVQAGSFDVTFATTGGTTTEQPKFNFTITKGANS